eukprot:14506305-Alexandrium_andersonii.AAC.1
MPYFSPRRATARAAPPSSKPHGQELANKAAEHRRVHRTWHLRRHPATQDCGNEHCFILCESALPQRLRPGMVCRYCRGVEWETHASTKTEKERRHKE